MKYILFFLIIPLWLTGVAQMPDYIVYMVKGKATAQKRNSLKGSQIKQHQLIYANETLIVDKGAEVTLSNKEARFWVLKSGKYKVDTLDKLSAKQQPGVTRKYIQLLYHELLDPHHDYSKFKKENLGGIWGGVSRGESCKNHIFPISGLKTSRDTIHFAWRNTGLNSSYSLQVFDRNRKEILNTQVNDTQYVLPVSRLPEGKGETYYWVLKGKNASCDQDEPHYYNLITETEEQEIVSSLQSEKKPISLLDSLQLIDIIERNGLIYAAVDYMAALAKEHPSDPVLKNHYVYFLLKYGFDKKAEAVWKEKPKFVLR